MPPTIQFPLDLPDVRVLSMESTETDDVLIRVESTLEYATCRVCERRIGEFHGHDAPIRLRHLPILGRDVYIEIRPRRYVCRACAGNPTSTQRCTWYTPNRPCTHAYEQWVLRALINSTIADVARRERLGYEAVMGILNRHVRTTIDWATVDRIGVLGLDEIALKKGHRNFVVVVTSRVGARIRVLAVLADRKKKTVKEFVDTIPAGVRATITSVCTDMHEAYSEAVRESLAKPPRIVVDRFHVARLYRKGPDTLRKAEMRRLKKALPKKEYKALKGAMWAFRRRPEKLEKHPEAKAALERLFALSPALKTAYDLREELTAIFDTTQSKRKAKVAIERWCDRVSERGATCFAGFLKTLDEWKEEILNYFVERETSGFVEGLNNRLKVLKRRCYGIFNVGHLFQRISLDLDAARIPGA
jgi:transposase